MRKWSTLAEGQRLRSHGNRHDNGGRERNQVLARSSLSGCFPQFPPKKRPRFSNYHAVKVRTLCVEESGDVSIFLVVS
jgi:hypothetical protein